MSDEKREGVDGEGGEKSIYFDANEYSQLLNSQLIASNISSSHDACSPWDDSPRTTNNASTTILSESETFTYRDDDSDNASAALEGTYMGHLRNQSLQAKQWVNELNIDPFIKLPSSASKPFAKQYWANKKVAGFVGEPLMEEMLSASRRAALFPALLGPVPPKNKIFATIFWVLFTAMLLLGLCLCLIYPNDLKDRIIRSGSMFAVIVDSIWILLSTLLIIPIIACFWITAFRVIPDQVITAMVLAAPVGSLLIGLVCLFEYFHHDPGSGIWLLITALTSITISLLSLAYGYGRHSSDITKTVNIVKTSANVLAANPGIYMISFLISFTYMIFILIWILFFSHALMLGHVDAAKHWQLSPFSYLIQAFFILMLLWTSRIFSGIQKCSIGLMVGKWYYIQSELQNDQFQLEAIKHTSWDALKMSLTDLFGQIACCSLVISLVKVIHGTINLNLWILSRISIGIFNPVIKSIQVCMGFAARLTEHLTEMSLYFVAFTGDGFWSASRNVFKILRRNMIMTFTADALAQTIFVVTTIVAAALVGVASYFFSAHTLHSSYGWVSTILFSFISWNILTFFTSIFSHTMDALFLCFVIDLDVKKLHHPAISQAFSHLIVTQTTPDEDL